mmetsp:Transcript_21080/g.65928  ORF Transcript_21080/g.65928 Transcript_21080/m.65928 type:complete len:200 (-) Transcript_21080:253-852(-)
MRRTDPASSRSAAPCTGTRRRTSRSSTSAPTSARWKRDSGSTCPLRSPRRTPSRSSRPWKRCGRRARWRRSRRRPPPRTSRRPRPAPAGGARPGRPTGHRWCRPSRAWRSCCWPATSATSLRSPSTAGSSTGHSWAPWGSCPGWRSWGLGRATTHSGRPRARASGSRRGWRHRSCSASGARSPRWWAPWPMGPRSSSRP